MSIAKCSIVTVFNDEKKMPETSLHFELLPYDRREILVNMKSQIDEMILRGNHPGETDQFSE